MSLAEIVARIRAIVMEQAKKIVPGQWVSGPLRNGTHVPRDILLNERQSVNAVHRAGLQGGNMVWSWGTS